MWKFILREFFRIAFNSVTSMFCFVMFLSLLCSDNDCLYTELESQ